MLNGHSSLITVCKAHKVMRPLSSTLLMCCWCLCACKQAVRGREAHRQPQQKSAALWLQSRSPPFLNPALPWQALPINSFMSLRAPESQKIQMQRRIDMCASTLAVPEPFQCSAAISTPFHCLAEPVVVR
mmetsp:Transcript_24646/g.67741  ORF Transcript_24646/g.67741 Transcript_24646/m.67741 type:complete len:130 (-) Transcript_24646:179-568(-)